MQKTIAVHELRKRFDAVLDEVAADHVPYVLTRDRHPKAALVPYEDFLRLQDWSRSEVLAEFDRMWASMDERTARFSEEEIAEDITAARAELRD